MWNSTTQKRAVHSSMASETVAVWSAAKITDYLKGFLIELGLAKKETPSLLYTDAACVVRHAATVKRAVDKTLIGSMGAIRERHESTVDPIRLSHLPGNENPADILTKAKVNRNVLIEILVKAKIKDYTKTKVIYSNKKKKEENALL